MVVSLSTQQWIQNLWIKFDGCTFIKSFLSLNVKHFSLITRFLKSKFHFVLMYQTNTNKRMYKNKHGESIH